MSINSKRIGRMVFACVTWLLLAVVSSAANDTAGTCIKRLHEDNAPVFAPFAEVMGEPFANSLRTFFLEDPIGKMLLSDSASVCFANMDGTALGKAFQSALASPQCSKVLTLNNTVFDGLIKRLTSPHIKQETAADLIKLVDSIRDTSYSEFDQLCQEYEHTIMPCVTSQLLPSLTVIRKLHSHGCCSQWLDHCQESYGMPPLQLITDMLEKVGNLACASQQPTRWQTAQMQKESGGIVSTSRVRCGATFFDNLLAGQSTFNVAKKAFEMLQVPRDQICLYAEGKEYKNTMSEVVPPAFSDTTSSPSDGGPMVDVTLSGCVQPLDEMVTWISGFPSTHKSSYDYKALFGTGRCIKGSEIAYVFDNLFPQIKEYLRAQLSKVCAHISTGYASECQFSRPASLIEWPADTLRKQAAALVSSSSSSKAATGTDSPKPLANAAYNHSHGLVWILLATVLCVTHFALL